MSLSEERRAPRLMLVVGEASADVYGALLVQAIRERLPDVRFLGMGGERMRAAGVHLLHNVSGRGTVGFAEAIRDYPLYRRLLMKLVEAARRVLPQACVLIDFPGFNLRLGPAIRRLGIPVVYYIPPAVWAWGSDRARAVAGFSSQVICAFDFEVPLYEKAGARATWLGHPILDDLPPRPPRHEALRQVGLGDGGPVLALLPGSRRDEIQRLYLTMLQSAAEVQRRRPEVRVVTSVAPGIDAESLDAMARARGDLVPLLLAGGIWKALGVADLAIVAAGTATLQAALWQVPMVTVYRTSQATYQVARRIVKLPYISLPNIVAGRRIVEEQIQGQATPERLAGSVLSRLESPDRLESERGELLAVRARLGEPGAARRAAEVVLEVLGR